MGTKRNGRCVYTIFDKAVLCAGSMTDYLAVKSRVMGSTSVDDLQAEPVFTLIGNYFGYLEVAKATTRFDGVTVDSATTHLYFIPFDQTVYELDINTLYVEKTATKNRLFKLTKIENYHEQDQWLVLYLSDKGFSENEAAQG